MILNKPKMHLLQNLPEGRPEEKLLGGGGTGVTLPCVQNLS